MSTTAEADVVICTMGHVSGDGAFSTGEKVRADHPAVARNPALFAAVDTPQSEWLSPYEGAIRLSQERKQAEADEQRRQLEEAARHNPLKLTAARIVTCQTDFVGHHDGRPALIRKGSTAAESDPVVRQKPEAWK